MNSDISALTETRRGHPVLQLFVSFPIACFTCALFTDIAYALSADMMWADFSAWLLAVGMGGGVLAAIAGIVVLVAERRMPSRRPAWPSVLGSLVVLVIAFLNNLVHSRDAWTSVMPTGLAFSAVTVLVMLATLWLAAGTGTRRVMATPYSGAAR